MIRQQHHINKTSTITNKNASLPDATINGRPEGYRKEGGFAEGFSKGWQLTKASDQRSNEVKIDMDLPYIDDVTDRESPTRKPKVRSGCGSFGSKYPDFGSESKESLEAPNIVRTPHNFAVIRYK